MGTPATRSMVTVRSLSVSAYVGTPPSRRKVASSEVSTVPRVRSQVGSITRWRLHASQAQNRLVGRPPDQWALAPVVLKPHTGLGDPGPIDPVPASLVRGLDLCHRPACRPLVACKSHGDQAVVGNVGADLAVRALHQLLDLPQERVDEVRAPPWLERITPSITPGDIVLDGPRVAAGQPCR